MDMRQYLSDEFVKIDHVRNGPLQVRIANVRAGQYDKADAVFESGEVLSLNSGNTRILVKAFGPNSESWIGKDIELSLGQVLFQGRLQDSVVVRPLSPPVAAHEREANTAEIIDDEIPF
jgi:hypothetical protein